MDPRLAFPRVAVAGGPAVLFCVAPGDDDPVAPWLLEHDWIDEPVQRAFQTLVEPGMRVLDAGSHLGVFSLPAAALGAEVTAVDANARHVELLREAVRRNGFEDRLEVVHSAVTAEPGTVEFVERSVHGHLRVEADGAVETVRVPGMTVPELLAQRGWDGVDLLKVDIEGGEVGALAGMAPLFDAGARPAIVFECNAVMLPLSGTSIVELRGTLLELGYELLMVDHLRPGVLLELAGPDAVQPEAVCDYVALPDGRPARLEERWTIEPPFTFEDTVRRVADVAFDRAAGYRRYAADLIAEGPTWLRDDPFLAAARRALALDESSTVRAAFATRERPGPGAEHAAAAVPARAGIALAVAGLALPARPGEADRAAGQDEPETSVSGVEVAVPTGRLLAVRAPRAEDAAAFLRVLAGWRTPVAGDVSADGPALLVATDDTGIEPSLTVEENFAVFASFAGGDVTAALERAGELTERAALQDPAAPLATLGVAGAARLMLTVAFELVHPRLLLVDALPPLGEPFMAWARARTRELLADGGVVVQAGDELLATAGLTLRLEPSEAAVAA